MNKPSKQIKLVVKNGGQISAIYDDALVYLIHGAEHAVTKRASHVEPDGYLWKADLSPVGGPLLRDFPTRQQALDAEVEYLNNNVIN